MVPKSNDLVDVGHWWEETTCRDEVHRQMSLRVTEDKPLNVAIMQISWLMWSLDRQDCPSGNMHNLILIKADDFAWETTHPTGERMISILNWFRLLSGPEMSWHSTVSIHTAKHPPGLLLSTTWRVQTGTAVLGSMLKNGKSKGRACACALAPLCLL